MAVALLQYVVRTTYWYWYEVKQPDRVGGRTVEGGELLTEERCGRRELAVRGRFHGYGDGASTMAAVYAGPGGRTAGGDDDRRRRPGSSGPIRRKDEEDGNAIDGRKNEGTWAGGWPAEYSR